MTLRHLEIRERGPYLEGRPFGDVGAYERIEAEATYAVDPAAPAHRAIVDLDLAAVDGDGLVTYTGDVTILRPADPSRAARFGLVEVPNRGRRTAVSMFNRAPMVFEPTADIDPGDGFLFRHGWTTVWCGWQWDVPRSPERMGLTAPTIATPVDSHVQLRLQLHEAVASVELTDHHVGILGGHTPVAVADTADPGARMLRRDELWDDPVEIDRAAWQFARDVEGEPVEDPTHVRLDGGFEPGVIYDLVYTPAAWPIAGAGLLAIRDIGSFLRSDADTNPCRGELDHLVATGQSQCGRFLRTFLHLGLNAGEDGRPAYDGILSHIAGGRRGEFNHRGAQPSVQPTPGFGHRFPFADDPQTDPRTGEAAGLLDAQREAGCVPLVMYTNTSSEYWRGDASLSHTSVDGGADIDPPDGTRHYLFASTQHGPGLLPLMSSSILGSHGGNLFNTVDYTPLMRAAVTNLRDWVVDDVEPPPNAVPRRDDGTGAEREEVLGSLAAAETLVRPRPASLPRIVPLDLGPDADHGVGTYPASAAGPAYPCLVSTVDGDGNEIAGIRSPEVSVPLGTHTGFNPRHPDSGGVGQILEYVGSSVPFPAADIAARYGGEEGYLDRVRAAAEELVARRHLLAEDVDTCVRICRRRYQAYVEAG